ncbi:protein LNK1 isoform X2 [Canna indica]|uniref:Protein LNK1 isoform X2 n=1 Tax=Canna indica TaxID=4628 RepID=A0AAQ3Q372_9LILI|nr:protein LNK1 isoform X2 [Canna indica]
MGDWSESEIEDIVFGRLVEKLPSSSDFLVTQQCTMENDVAKTADNIVSKNKGAVWRKEGMDICPSQEIGSSSVAEGLQSKTSSTNNSMDVSRGAEEEIDICQLSFDNKTSADSEFTFLGNDNDQEKDFLYYDWTDMSNFEDVDKMFRNCDPTFGRWSNTEGPSWISSSSNDIFVPEDTFASGLESSTLEFIDFDDASDYCANIRSLPESSTTQVDNHKQSSLTHQSFGLCTSAGQAYDGGGQGETKSALTAFGDVNKLDGHKINIQTQQLNRKLSSDAKEKGLQPYPQFLSKQNSFIKSGSSSYLHTLDPDANMENKFLYQEVFLPTTSSTASECLQNPSSSYVVPAHVISGSFLANLPDSLSKGPVMKPKELVDKPNIGPFEMTNSVKKQHDRFDQEIHNDRGNMNLQLHPTDIDSIVAQSSPISSVFSDDLTVKAISFQQLHDVIGQLDLRTKLCIRDSLYRLARSAEQRHSFTAANNEQIDCGRGLRIAGTPQKSVEYINIETETNPIDRSVAHLLFHRPPEAATSSAEDAISLESHMMA